MRCASHASVYATRHSMQHAQFKTCCCAAKSGLHHTKMAISSTGALAVAVPAPFMMQAK